MWSDPELDSAFNRPTDGGVPYCELPRCFGEIAFGSDGFEVCLTSEPTAPLSLGSDTIDTGTCPGGVIESGSDGGPSLCVLAGTSVSVTGMLRATGVNALVLLATAGDLVVTASGGVDVSSHNGGLSGAGAGSADSIFCANVLDGVDWSNGWAGTTGGGGAGGSMISDGGHGGLGGGSGGFSGIPVQPLSIRGGCPGGNGGDGQDSAGGAGGNSGGAMYLFARGNLQIDGPLDASGAGGAPASATMSGMSGGGGGGGTGGLIALFASVGIEQTGDIYANGGGGGGAPGTSAASPGGESLGPAVAGGGGSGGTGGAGGDGAIGTGPGSDGVSNPGGGGGGGGGVGYVDVLSGQPLGTNVSPPPCGSGCGFPQPHGR